MRPTFLGTLLLATLAIGPAYGNEEPASPETAETKVPAPAADELPAGPGRDALLKGCTGSCHDLDRLTQPYSAQQWVDKVDNMIGLGAVISDEDYVPVILYLVEHFTSTAPPP